MRLLSVICYHAMMIVGLLYTAEHNMTAYISQKLTIPRLGQAESLNAAMATGIILDNIFRDNI